ncbi:MAG TPA: CPBP family intramembrane glutamic endopeptidase [Alphaproteobacteria bacterium]|nr:CPBP family intramembrane glutamic endopeptidase [Alphaproteobacteria bacterium]
MSAAVDINLITYLIAIAFGVYAILSWRRAGASVAAGLGLSADSRAARDFVVGVAITSAVMLAILAVELALGGVRVTRVPFAAGAAAKAGLALIIQGGVDELLMRGMLISGLALALGGRRLAAVLIASVLFGLAHMFFKGASGESVISNAIGGITYGLAFILTGRIWLGLGLHFAWNFAEGPLLGFPVSGYDFGAGVFHIADLGPVWMTGGAYGPEGGVVGIAFRFVVIAAVLAWVRFGPQQTELGRGNV